MLPLPLYVVLVEPSPQPLVAVLTIASSLPLALTPPPLVL